MGRLVKIVNGGLKINAEDGKNRSEDTEQRQKHPDHDGPLGRYTNDQKKETT